MTTLLAYHDGKRGYMAADGQQCAGRERTTNSARKIIRAGKWLVGSSGPTLFQSVLREHVSELAEATSVWALSRTIRDLLSRYGISGAVDPEGGGNTYSGDFLVVSEDGAWSIFKDLTPGQQDRPCSAGSGGVFAAGALAALLLHSDLPIERMMQRAVEIAISFDTGSGGSVQVEVTE